MDSAMDSFTEYDNHNIVRIWVSHDGSLLGQWVK